MPTFTNFTDLYNYCIAHPQPPPPPSFFEGLGNELSKVAGAIVDVIAPKDQQIPSAPETKKQCCRCGGREKDCHHCAGSNRCEHS
jgi:hypothetical protein